MGAERREEGVGSGNDDSVWYDEDGQQINYALDTHDACTSDTCEISTSL